MHIIDRVKELRRVKASELRPHPRNWRTHPAEQADALRGVLAEVGFADALVVRELADGSLQIIDGHLRAETVADALVPVLVVDLSDEEAEKVLLTHDPIAALAGADESILAELAAKVSTQSEAVQRLIDDLASTATPDFPPMTPPELPQVEVPESYQVVIDCHDEAEQQHVYERMKREGFRCRVLTV